MVTARNVMTPGAHCVRTDETALDAARTMDNLGVGAVPICGPDDRLKGVVTDRDLVVKVLAKSRRLDFPAGDLNQEEAVTVGAEDPVTDVVATMTSHAIRRVPVVDGTRLVGMISVADLSTVLSDDELGALVRTLSSPTRAPVS